MTAPRLRNWALPGALGAVAALGPFLVGTADAPAVMPSAAQLLRPGTVVEEVVLEGGGIARAPRVEVPAGGGLRIVSPSGWRTFQGARAAAEPRRRRLWLGSDHQGRDLLAQTFHGARTSLLVAALAAFVAVALGTGIGLASALAGEVARRGLRLVADGALGLPRLLLLLMLGAALQGSATGVALAIGLASWMEVARLVEAESGRLARRAFFAAARASGAAGARLALRHLLPNVSPVLAAAAPLVATEAVLLESTLSFLGVSAGAGAVSWGRMVADGQRLLPDGWWLVVFPGLLLCLTALALHELTGPMGRRMRGAPGA